MLKIGVVVPIDYLSVHGGAVQRVKVDVAALLGNGYDVEIIFPSRVKRLQHGLYRDCTAVPAALRYAFAFCEHQISFRQLNKGSYVTRTA